MVQFRQLANRDTNSHQIFTMHLHGVPFTSVFKALWYRNWYHAFIAFNAVLAEVLLVLVAGVPYNYGQIKNVTFYSSLITVIILAIMIVAMASLVFWNAGNPKMARKPEALVNIWLMMCSSGFIEEFQGRPLAEVVEEIDQGNKRYWFGKAMGVDQVERWMIETGQDPTNRALPKTGNQDKAEEVTRRSWI